MDAIQLLRQQVQTAHEVMEGTAGDLSPEQARHEAGGTTMNAGVLYAHAVLGEDVFINMLVRGQQPLSMTEFAGKSGISEPPPQGAGMDEWAKRVKIDLPAVRSYAQAVYKGTDEYIASLAPEELEKEIDLPGFGKYSLAWILSMIAVIHPSNHCGEISTIKGVQGAKGYPF